jgi:hypothetical protein
MDKHKPQVKEMIKRNGELLKDLFLNDQNIRNMARKLTKETYKKHENYDAQSVCMWVAENINNVFFLLRD